MSYKQTVPSIPPRNCAILQVLISYLFYTQQCIYVNPNLPVYPSSFSLLPTLFTIPLLGMYPEKTIIIKDTGTPMFIAALFAIVRTWKQPRCPLTDEWVKKLQYIYTLEYYSAIKRNKSESVLVRWMNPETVIQSEVSQKEKDIYFILKHICEIQKDGTNNPDPTCRAAKETHMYKTDFSQWEKVRVG